METCRMEFSGKLLRRGFWLYVWDIREDYRRHLYVGRTGDSSSPHASSPFRRIGQHLDLRLNAKSNSLLRGLQAANVVPEACTFEMIAIGPIFEEQKDMDSHKPFRDRTGSLEGALAAELKRRGYDVLGKHPSPSGADKEILMQVISELDRTFPERRNVPRVLNFQPIVPREGSVSIAEIIIRDRGEY